MHRVGVYERAGRLVDRSGVGAVTDGERQAVLGDQLAGGVLVVDRQGEDLDVQDVELPRLPDVGESLETKFGTMLVAEADEAPDLTAYAGRIVCRFS